MQVNLGSFSGKDAYIRGKSMGKNNRQNMNAPSFGKKDVVTETMENLVKQAAGKKLSFIDKMEDLKGELGSIVITAVGTGMVAPFMIAFNPIAKPKPDATEEQKQDYEKTKKYTAMRQPLSALLSIAIQTSVLKPIDRLLESFVNNPGKSVFVLDHIDRSSLPDKDYIARKLLTDDDKINYVIEEKLTDDDTAKYLTENTKNKTSEQIEYFTKEFHSKSVEEQNKEVAQWKISEESLEDAWKKDKYSDVAKWKSEKYEENIAKLMLNDKESRIIINPGVVKDADIKEYLAERKQGKSAAEISKIEGEFNAKSKELQNNEVMLWKIEKSKDIRYVTPENMKRVVNDLIDDYITVIDGDADVLGLKYHEKGRGFYKDRANTLISNETYLKDKLASDIIKEKLQEDSSGQKLKEYLTKLKDEQKTTTMQKIFDEIIDRESADLMESRCARTLDRIETIKKVCGGTYDANTYGKYIDKHDAILDEARFKLLELRNNEKLDTSTAIKEIEGVLGNIQKSTAKSYGSIPATLGINNLSKGQVREKIGKDLVKTHKKFVADAYKGTNTWTKMLVGIFITLPITCTLLNWVYPRFMNIFFPDLAGVKKPSANDNAQGGQNGNR